MLIIQVIRDVNGCSKGYSFVDFRSEDEAKRLLEEVIFNFLADF